MTEPFNDQDQFTRSAGRQLLLIAVGTVIGLALLMFGLAWGSQKLGGAGVSAGVDPKTGTITAVLADEPPQLNSSVSTDTISSMVLGHVMEGLLRAGTDGKPMPGVAERWEITPTEATFWLRKNARWSDGKPVTAHDFVFAWRVAVDPKTASEYATMLFAIKNGEAINEGKLPVSALGVTAIDDYTLKVELSRSVPFFDKLLPNSVFKPIREDFYEAMKGRYGADADKLLYNGPFIMTRWVHGARLTMAKNPNYWDQDKVKIKVLDFPYFTSDANTILNLFKDGKVAHAALTEENMNGALLDGWQLNSYASGAVFYVEFNHRPGRVTGNKNLRKAIQLVLDPGELTYRVLKRPGLVPGKSLFPLWLPGVNGYFRQEYPAKEVTIAPIAARRYLELAKKELRLKEIPPLTLLSGDSPITDKQTEYYQQTLKRELGLEIRIDKQIFKQRLAKMTSGDFDMVLAGWNPDYADALTFGDLFASWNLNNRGRYKNLELDRQVAIAQNSTDVRTRLEAFAAIQKIVIDDVVVLPNYEVGVVYVVDPRMKGLARRVAAFDPDYTNVRIVEK